MSHLYVIQHIRIVERTYYCSLKQYDGMGIDQLGEVQRLMKANGLLNWTIFTIALNRRVLKKA